MDTYESFDLAKEVMTSYEWNETLVGKMIFVDCYSWRIGAQGGKYPGHPKDLTELSIVIDNLLSRELTSDSRARFVIDSSSDFINHAGPERANKFLESIKAKLAERKITSLVLLEEGLHEERVNAAAEYVADGTIRMKYEEAGRSLMVRRMIATPVNLKWIPFNLARGVDLAVANYFR